MDGALSELNHFIVISPVLAQSYQVFQNLQLSGFKTELFQAFMGSGLKFNMWIFNHYLSTIACNS